MKNKLCIECNDEILGRKGKKFCNAYCKTNYHNKNAKTDLVENTINKTLKNNRKILLELYPGDEIMVQYKILVDRGFDFNYCTGFELGRDGNAKYYCYELEYAIIKTSWCSIQKSTKFTAAF